MLFEKKIYIKRLSKEEGVPLQRTWRILRRLITSQLRRHVKFFDASLHLR